MTRCEVKYCRGESDLGYYTHNICFNCFNRHVDKKINLKTEFNIKEGDTND